MSKTLSQEILAKSSVIKIESESVDTNVFRYLERINSMAPEILDEINQSPTPSRLRHFIKEVQELLQILSIPQSLFHLQSSAEQQRQIEYLAFYDSLTGLSNRQFFETHVKQLIEAANTDSTFYIVFLDLDGFKDINDTYGHEIGDLVLKQVAERLKNNVRSQDLVARFGGDEFTILLQFDKKRNLDYILKRLIASLTNPIEVHSLCLPINVSIGVSTFPISGDSCESLIKKADKAMYMSKARGNNLYTVHR